MRFKGKCYQHTFIVKVHSMGESRCFSWSGQCIVHHYYFHKKYYILVFAITLIGYLYCQTAIHFYCDLPSLQLRPCGQLTLGNSIFFPLQNHQRVKIEHTKCVVVSTLTAKLISGQCFAERNHFPKENTSSLRGCQALAK